VVGVGQVLDKKGFFVPSGERNFSDSGVFFQNAFWEKNSGATNN
jgi:hypothetical protein